MLCRNRFRLTLAALPCLLAVAVPAIAQRAQFAPQTAYSRLDKLSARVEAVRYENVASNRPFVIVYVMVRNESTAPVLLGSNTFEGTTLANGSTVHSGVGHTFPHGFGVGEEGRLETRTLAAYSTFRIAFRYQLSGSVPTAPLRLTLREKPLLKFPGKGGGGQTMLEVAGYAGDPASPAPLQTPPQAPVDPDGYQTARVPDESFRALGPVRARVDGVRYGKATRNSPGAEYIQVMTTIQNTLPVTLILKASSLTSVILGDNGSSPRKEAIDLFRNAGRASSYTLAPGEWVSAHFVHYYPDQKGLRAARQVSLLHASSEQAGGSFTIDIPRFTALAEPSPEAQKQAPAPSASSAAGAGDFRKTAYMDVRLEGVKTGKYGGVDVTVTVRNKIGRRLGMQHDWQNYTVLGSDGEEYRTDGNHYGSSADDRLANTVWLENDQEAKRTYVFPKFPLGETATRLIIREYGKEVASFDLPK